MDLKVTKIIKKSGWTCGCNMVLYVSRVVQYLPGGFIG